EKDGTVTNSERRISRQRAVLPPPGDARPDWWLIAEVARRLGFGHAFTWRHPAEIFDEHARLSGAAAAAFGRHFDIAGLAGLSRQQYDALEPVQWPVPAGSRDGTARVVPSQRLIALHHRPPVERPMQPGELVLNTGRLRDQWHTMTR
ncbi:MAG TPA: nitrate reductase, partial [Tistrella mobilis]|nr:nitrate reductase [Tistrella mobilis]